MTNYTLFWKDIEVGEFIEESIDMGYLDGKFINNESEEANAFIKMISQFDVKTVILNPRSGIRATLKDKTEFRMNVLVTGLFENMQLSLKMVIGKQEKIDWFLKNVPEEQPVKTPSENKFWSKLNNFYKKLRK